MTNTAACGFDNECERACRDFKVAFPKIKIYSSSSSFRRSWFIRIGESNVFGWSSLYEAYVVDMNGQIHILEDASYEELFDFLSLIIDHGLTDLGKITIDGPSI